MTNIFTTVYEFIYRTIFGMIMNAYYDGFTQSAKTDVGYDVLRFVAKYSVTDQMTAEIHKYTFWITNLIMLAIIMIVVLIIVDVVRAIVKTKMR